MLGAMVRLDFRVMALCFMSNLWLGSEQELQTELKLLIVLRRPSDDSRIAVSNRETGKAEVSPIEVVEGLKPEFDL